MKKLMLNHPVKSFIVVTFLYSWTLWLLMILSARELLPFKFSTNFLGSFGPAAGALTVIVISRGSAGLKEIWKSIIRFRAPASTYLFATIYIMAVYVLTAAVVYFIEPETLKTGDLPGIPEMIIYFFVIAVLGGPVGEEIGWRGFLQPELMKRFNPSITSLIIACTWFIWHIPLFWLEGAAQEGGSLIYFAISVFSMSVLFTWLYIRSSGSLFLAILFHTMINYISAFIIPSLLPQTESGKTFGHISVFLLLLTAIFFLLALFRVFKPRKDMEVSVA